MCDSSISRDQKVSVSQNRRAGFTLTELLVVISIMGILMGMLLPAVASVWEASNRTLCGKRLNQIWALSQKARGNLGAVVKANSVRYYTQLYVDGKFVMGKKEYEESLEEQEEREDIDPGLFDCPTNEGSDDSNSYGFNARLHRFSAKGDSKKVFALDYKKEVANLVGYTDTDGELRTVDDWEEMSTDRHTGATNIVFADGHVEAMLLEAINPNTLKIQKKHWVPKLDKPLLGKDGEHTFPELKERDIDD